MFDVALKTVSLQGQYHRKIQQAVQTKDLVLGSKRHQKAPKFSGERSLKPLFPQATWTPKDAMSDAYNKLFPLFSFFLFLVRTSSSLGSPHMKTLGSKGLQQSIPQSQLGGKRNLKCIVDVQNSMLDVLGKRKHNS